MHANASAAWSAASWHAGAESASIFGSAAPCASNGASSVADANASESSAYAALRTGAFVLATRFSSGCDDSSVEAAAGGSAPGGAAPPSATPSPSER